MRRLIALFALLALASTLLTAAAAAGDDDPTTWKVTITNLTDAQPLSPPLFVTHAGRSPVWKVGDVASHVVAAIAEDANNAPAESALPQLDGVEDAVTGAGGPILPGTTREYLLEDVSHPRLSLVTMLVNTNDAFTGLDSVLLRDRARLLTDAYDAGSEANDEQAESIPGPCCGNPFVRVPEGELIRHHPGIAGIGDLDPAVYGWDNPVARITIERG